MGKYSKAAHEPATLWHSRIRGAQRVWEGRRYDLRKFREAVALRFQPLLPGTGADELELDVPHIDQININLSRRYVDWLQSQATDEQPLITYPRDAEPNERVAGMNEMLLGRVLQEARGIEELRDAIPSICSTGCSAMWVGIHEEIVSAEGLVSATKDPATAVDDALLGQHQPSKGQDHAPIEAALTSAASQPMADLRMGGQAFENLLDSGKAHDDLLAEEASDVHHVRIKRGRIWMRRSPVGSWTVWDHSVWDIKDARWMARKIVMTEDEAKRYDSFKPGIWKKLKKEPLTDEEGYEPLMRLGTEPTIKEGEDQSNDDMRIIIWEVWDKRHYTRHLINEGLHEYLEKDETYPYLDDNGEPYLPNFFPCRVIAPLLTDDERPDRTLGIPLLALGWPQQEEIIKLRSYALSQAKRHAVRIYEADPNLDEDSQAAITAGVDGTVIRRDPSVEPGKTLIPVQFHVGSQDISKQAADVYSEWSIGQGMPASDLTSKPQADTATQEMQGIQAGRQQAGDIVRQLEIGTADIIEDMRGLIRGYYSDEQVAQLIGFKWLPYFAEWQRSSLEGDRIQVQFAARAKAQNAVRVKQMMDCYTLLRTDVDPMTGAPKWNTEHLLADIVRALGCGELVPWQMDVMQMQAMQAAQGGGEDQGQAGEGGEGTGLPQDRDAAGNQSGNTTSGSLMAAAARSAPDAPAPGEALTT